MTVTSFEFFAADLRLIHFKQSHSRNHQAPRDTENTVVYSNLAQELAKSQDVIRRRLKNPDNSGDPKAVLLYKHTTEPYTTLQQRVGRPRGWRRTGHGADRLRPVEPEVAAPHVLEQRVVRHGPRAHVKAAEHTLADPSRVVVAGHVRQRGVVENHRAGRA